ncbi:hypothetical protein AFGD_008066 [Aspergillus flavus]|nr:hypothetical protein AFGD_008066 [Aspergillus flavus]
MRLFSLLTASTLALFVSPSFANSPLGTVIIKTSNSESAHFVHPYQCVTVYPDIQDKPVSRIEISPYRPDSGIECTFYKDPQCHSSHSHSYTLHEGSHTFKRRFLVSSFNSYIHNTLNVQFEAAITSEIVPIKNGTNGYRWIMTSQERAHIAGLLDTDESTIPRGGNVIMRERAVCTSCGKHSGLDDLVHSALDRGIHGRTYMLDIPQNGAKENSPKHYITCSGCGTLHDRGFGCYGYEKWFA